jgi:acetyltransferase
MTIKSTTVRLNDRWVTIRPIRSTDAAMEIDFIRKRLGDVDGPHAMAFVATVEEQGREVEVGVCRYALGGKSDVRETAITVADEWQQTELAKLLMQHLLASARQFGIRRLYTTEFADNQAMRRFAQDFGMTSERDPGDATQVIYSLGI